MPGPPPKPPGQRRRRNKATTAAFLVAPAKPVALPVDLDGYCPQVQAWLRDIASSPMASEWDRSDAHGIVMLADLMEAYWQLPHEKAMQKATLAAEIRLQRAEYGLTALARRRLQWEIERGEDAAAKTAARRQTTSAAKKGDPRRRKET